MSIFKKLFGSKNNEKPQQENINSNNIESSPSTPPMLSETRQKTLSVCQSAGFTPANSLPTELNRQLRPKIEIGNRLHAIKALVLWLMVPQDNLPNEKILSFIDNNNLQNYMTEQEKTILTGARDDEQQRNAIGWKFENAWPLAWYFGYTEPEITGQMMDGDQMKDILTKHTCSLDKTVQEWVNSTQCISENELAQKEDLFYCLHNAVRSAQLGGNTVPQGFNPVGNGGVIHERRHALTWMLSKGTSWEETDLST